MKNNEIEEDKDIRRMKKRKYQNIMKKAATLLCIAMVATGCGGNSAGAPDVAVQTVYESVSGAVELPSMVEGDDDYISNYYGIDPEDLDEYIFAEAEDAALASTVIIMKAKSEDAVSRLTASLNTVLDQKAAEMQDYIPEQYDIVADSSVKTEGCYVYLVISENAAKIESAIQSALK